MLRSAHVIEQYILLQASIFFNEGLHVMGRQALDDLLLIEKKNDAKDEVLGSSVMVKQIPTFFGGSGAHNGDIFLPRASENRELSVREIRPIQSQPETTMSYVPTSESSKRVTTKMMMQREILPFPASSYGQAREKATFWRLFALSVI